MRKSPIAEESQDLGKEREHAEQKSGLMQPLIFLIENIDDSLDHLLSSYSLYLF